MKMMIDRLWHPTRFQLLARFGEAKLLAREDGKLELRGGTVSDRIEAREWISLFMHEAVPQEMED
jgi:hypothetical protein